MNFQRLSFFPQGEFQKFLEDKSSGRQKILEKLFPTNLHFAITELARNRRNEIKQEMKLKSKQIENLEERFDPETFKNDKKKIQLKLEGLEKNIREFEGKIEKTAQKFAKEEELDKQFKDKELTETELQELKKKGKEIQNTEKSVENALKAAVLEADINQLHTLKDEIRKSEDEIIKHNVGLKKANKDLEKIQKKIKNIPGWEKEVKDEQKEVGKLGPLVEKEKRLAILKSQKKETEETFTEVKESLTKDKKERKKFKETILKIKKDIKTTEKLTKGYATVLKSLTIAEKKLNRTKTA